MSVEDLITILKGRIEGKKKESYNAMVSLSKTMQKIDFCVEKEDNQNSQMLQTKRNFYSRNSDRILLAKLLYCQVLVLLTLLN